MYDPRKSPITPISGLKESVERVCWRLLRRLVVALHLLLDLFNRAESAAVLSAGDLGNYYFGSKILRIREKIRENIFPLHDRHYYSFVLFNKRCLGFILTGFSCCYTTAFQINPAKSNGTFTLIPNSLPILNTPASNIINRQIFQTI